MQYRIKKCIDKSLSVKSDEHGYTTNKVITNTYYIGYRKGKTFGFWHKLGHEYCGWDGDLIAHTTKTPEEMEDYIRKWHEVRYGQVPCEIIKEFTV